MKIFKWSVLGYLLVLGWAFNYHIKVEALFAEAERAFSSLYEYEDLTTVEKEDLFKALVKYHKHMGVKFPLVASAQVIEETGYLTSRYSKDYNNFYGMKCDESCGCKGRMKDGFAYYESYQESTKSYLCWQNKRLRDNPGVYTQEDYLRSRASVLQ